VERAVTVVVRDLLVLRTDRTQYQPGQPVRWRTTSLNAVDAHPVGGATIGIELRDPRGTLLWRDTAKTDAHGMASGAIPMSDATLYGDYVVHAASGGVKVEEEVSFRRVAMPRMVVAFEDVEGPDDKGVVSGVVSARYPYGESA